jgi:hypothetical protein
LVHPILKICLRRTKRQVSWTKPRKLLRDIPQGRGCDVAIGSWRKSVRRVGVAGNGLAVTDLAWPASDGWNGAARLLIQRIAVIGAIAD